MLGANAFELAGYFSKRMFSKTILQNFRFFVTIYDKSMFTTLPVIQHWHVLSVTLPNYDWKKESLMYGPVPKSFPYLEYDGLELKMNLEEDEFGTISDFIHSLQKRVLNTDGTYNAPNKVYIDRIMVTVEDRFGIVVNHFTFHECFLLQASDIEFNYGSNDSIKYDLTFNCDYYSVLYPKRALINAAKTIVSEAVSPITENIKDAAYFKKSANFFKK